VATPGPPGGGGVGSSISSPSLINSPMVEGVTGGVFFLYKDHQSRGEARRGERGPQTWMTFCGLKGWVGC
jgi:hypothetical protein